MTTDFPAKKDMDQILPCLLDGTLSAKGEAKLWELLAKDAKSRAYYLDYIELHSALHSLYVAPDDLRAMAVFNYSEEPDSRQSDNKLTKQSPILGFLGDYTSGNAGKDINLTMLALCVVGITTLMVTLTTVAVLSVVTFWMPQHDHNVVAELSEPATHESVARLTQAMDCRWANGEYIPKIDDFLLPERTLQLEEGLAEITFESGVTMVLEAPAVFTPKSNYGGTLQFGRLTAKVPASGIGFAIETPSVRVVDLGTEFGVQVDKEQMVEVHVLKGKVATTWIRQQGDNQKIIRLSQNDAAIFDPRNKTVEREVVKANQFVCQMPQAPRTRFYTNEAEWLAVVDQVETFSPQAQDLIQADEVATVPQAGQTLAPVLNFASSSTRLSRSFRLTMLEPGNGKGHGFVFDDFNKPGDSPGFDNALSVGKIGQFSDDDWQIDITSGPRLYAFAFDLCDNIPAKGESFSVYGTGNRLLGRFSKIPGANIRRFFLGVVSNSPIIRCVFDEDHKQDNMAIANLRFATTKEKTSAQ